nr:unnamed protein product [Digitaria exilis]
MDRDAPLVYRSFSSDNSSKAALLKAALDGDLGRIKGIMKSIGIKNSDRAAVFSFTMGGFGVLHCAACQGHLEVCKYLVEELKGDPNMAASEGPLEGATAFMISVQSGDISTVEYLFDHGGDLMKTDAKGRTILHYAVCTGSTTVSGFLLSKGIPVDIDCGHGTPLYHACINEQDKTVKILLNHHANAGADVNGKGSVASPLVFATGCGGYTNFIHLLLKAGADPNIPDDKEHIKVGKTTIRSQADEAFRRKEYDMASKFYTELIDVGPDATLYSNRSLCKLKLGDGEGALSDAYQCRMLRPDWAKACYRQATAHMLLKEYKQACDALLDAQKLDPGNDMIERELSKALELMMISPDEH